MKKIVALIFLVLALGGGEAAGHNRHGGHRGHGVYEQRCCHDKTAYFVSDDKVFYEGNEIKGASASSFRVLSDG